MEFLPKKGHLTHHLNAVRIKTSKTLTCPSSLICLHWIVAVLIHNKNLVSTQPRCTSFLHAENRVKTCSGVARLRGVKVFYYVSTQPGSSTNKQTRSGMSAFHFIFSQHLNGELKWVFLTKILRLMA